MEPRRGRSPPSSASQAGCPQGPPGPPCCPARQQGWGTQGDPSAAGGVPGLWATLLLAWPGCPVCPPGPAAAQNPPGIAWARGGRGAETSRRRGVLRDGGSEGRQCRACAAPRGDSDPRAWRAWSGASAEGRQAGLIPLTVAARCCQHLAGLAVARRSGSPGSPPYQDGAGGGRAGLQHLALLPGSLSLKPLAGHGSPQDPLALLIPLWTVLALRPPTRANWCLPGVGGWCTSYLWPSTHHPAPPGVMAGPQNVPRSRHGSVP